MRELRSYDENIEAYQKYTGRVIDGRFVFKPLLKSVDDGSQHSPLEIDHCQRNILQAYALIGNFASLLEVLLTSERVIKQHRIDIFHRDTDGNMFIHYLAMSSSYSCQQISGLIIDYDLDVRPINFKKQTAVDIAKNINNQSFLDAVEAVEAAKAVEAAEAAEAVEGGEVPDILDDHEKTHKTPLHKAIELIIEKEASKINADGKETEETEETDEIEDNEAIYLLDDGANPNALDSQLRTPMHYAAAAGLHNLTYKMVKFYGGNLTLSDENSLTVYATLKLSLKEHSEKKRKELAIPFSKIQSFYFCQVLSSDSTMAYLEEKWIQIIGKLKSTIKYFPSFNHCCTLEKVTSHNESDVFMYMHIIQASIQLIEEEYINPHSKTNSSLLKERKRNQLGFADYFATSLSYFKDRHLFNRISFSELTSRSYQVTETLFEVLPFGYRHQKDQNHDRLIHVCFFILLKLKEIKVLAKPESSPISIHLPTAHVFFQEINSSSLEEMSYRMLMEIKPASYMDRFSLFKIKSHSRLKSQSHFDDILSIYRSISSHMTSNDYSDKRILSELFMILDTSFPCYRRDPDYDIAVPIIETIINLQKATKLPFKNESFPMNDVTDTESETSAPSPSHRRNSDPFNADILSISSDEVDTVGIKIQDFSSDDEDIVYSEFII